MRGPRQGDGQQGASQVFLGEAKINGVPLEYLDWGGNGDPLLFIPGGCDTAHVFGDIAPAFVNRFHVFSLTPRGCGRSAHCADHYGLDVDFEDMVGFLQFIGAENVILAGHSSGAAKILQFALKNVGLVERLVCLETMYRYIAPGLEQLLMQAARSSVGSPPATSLDAMRRHERLWELGAWSEARERNLYETVVVQTDGSIRPSVSRFWRRAFLADLSAGKYANTTIIHPTLMIFSINLGFERLERIAPNATEPIHSLVRETEAARWAQIEEFRRNGPHVEILALPTTGHYCFVHRPRVVIDRMQRFLNARKKKY